MFRPEGLFNKALPLVITENQKRKLQFVAEFQEHVEDEHREDYFWL